MKTTAAAVTKEVSFMVACKDYFGYRPGDTLSDFMKEIRLLTEKDKLDMIQYFKAIGVHCT